MNAITSSHGGFQSFPAPDGHLRRRADIGPTGGPWPSEQQTEQFLGWVFPWTASAPCCSDADIARALGIALDASRNGLFGFDSAFSGPSGVAFAVGVGYTAGRVGLDPGLLAANLLAEIQDRAAWMSLAPLQSHQVGVDYWHDERTRIRRAVPAAATIRESMVRDASGRPQHFTNEQHKDTGPKYEFATGPDGMLALACAVAYRDVRLRSSVRPGVYDRLSPAVRFAAARVAFNAGLGHGLRMVKEAAAGRDPLVRRGPVRRRTRTGRWQIDARRAASLRAGQAIHLSCTVFHNTLRCP